MKKILFAAYCCCIFLSCSKKTVPSKSNVEINNIINDTAMIISDSATATVPVADSASAISANIVMVIADAYGRLITPQKNLPPDASVKYNNLQLSKGFTVQQRANLQARYNTIPPRVLYVPAQLSSSSLKGNYYILKKKFWYWKKSDGLYYLDSKYYL
jgi:hypothetical protein